MPKIKVVFCTDGIYPLAMGGMQKHSRMLIDALSRNAELDIVVLHPHDKQLFSHDNVSEIFITPIDESKNYLFECYKYSRRIYSEIISIQPDIIYSQGLCVWYGINNLKDKLVVNPHGLEPYQATGIKNRILAVPFRVIFNYLFRRCATVISLGGKLSDMLTDAVPEIKIREIPNGVEIPAQTNGNTMTMQPVKVLFFARFVHNKGIDILFEALDILFRNNQLSNFRFTLAGTGPLYGHYLKENKYEEVKLIGFVPDEKVSDLYTNHDLFLFPTRYEGMPTVVLEAMSYGLPVVVSDVGACSVLVGDDNGKLIAPGDANAVVSGLNWFYQLPVEERQHLSRESRTKARDRFQWHIIAGQHADLFQELASKKRVVAV